MIYANKLTSSGEMQVSSQLSRRIQFHKTLANNRPLEHPLQFSDNQSSEKFQFYPTSLWNL